MTSSLIAFSETLLSDMYKDAYGSRPRGVYPEYMTDAAVQTAYAQLSVIIERETLEQQDAELRNQRALETRVSSWMEIGAPDRATALRWEWEANGELLDLGYWAYKLGISYALVPAYLTELRSAGIPVYE